MGGDSVDGGSQIGGQSQRRGPAGQSSNGNLQDLRTRKMNTSQRRGDQAEGDFEKMFGKDVD